MPTLTINPPHSMILPDSTSTYSSFFVSSLVGSKNAENPLLFSSYRPQHFCSTVQAWIGVAAIIRRDVGRARRAYIGVGACTPGVHWRARRAYIGVGACTPGVHRRGGVHARGAVQRRAWPYMGVQTNAYIQMSGWCSNTNVTPPYTAGYINCFLEGLVMRHVLSENPVRACRGW